MRRASIAPLLALLVTLVAACAGGSTPSQTVDQRGDPTPAPDLTVFAAASLKTAVERAAEAYSASNAGMTIVVSTDSSAALATQIEQGAPADVFLSADTANPQKLVDGGFAVTAVTFAANDLTIIVPLDNPAGIEVPADLANDGVRIVAAGDDVPITTYAKELIDNLAALDGYREDFAAAYAANVVSREDNVKAVVAKIELGEGDAGVVYATDARASTKVTTIAVPARANVTATYAGVVVNGSSDLETAQAFLHWFAGPAGQAILAQLGFLPPPA